MSDNNNNKKKNVYITFTSEQGYKDTKADIINGVITDTNKIAQYEQTLFITNQGGTPSKPSSQINCYLGSQLISDIIILNRFSNITITENTTTKRLKVVNNLAPTTYDEIGNINKLYIWYNISDNSTVSFNLYRYDDVTLDDYKYVPITKNGGTTQTSSLNFVNSEAYINDETKYTSKTWVYFDQPNPDAPPYDTSITYIQANGTQFIDTDIYFTAQHQSLEITVEWPNGLPTQSYMNLSNLSLYNANKLFYYDFIGAFKQGNNSVYDNTVTPPQLVYIKPQSNAISCFNMYNSDNTEINTHYMFRDSVNFIWNEATNGEKQKFTLTDKSNWNYGVEVISTGESYNQTSFITANWTPLTPLRIFGFKGYTGNFNEDYQGTSTLYADVPDTIYTYATIRLYDIKITDVATNTLSHHLIPAIRNADGIVGLYDEITDVFYINNGTGTFDHD